MLGTIVNTAAVAVGGALGLICKKGIRESWTVSVNKALGVAVAIIGVNGVVANMFSVQDGSLSSSGELLLVVSLVLGTLLGELLRLDDRLERFSKGLEQKLSSKGEKGGFAQSFMSASILFCVGAMTIIGSLNDGLTGDAGILYIKSALDFVSAIIFGATLGWGVCFAAVPVLVYQGAITLFAGALSGILQGALLQQVCMVGYAIIICIGVNFLATTRIKTLNMLPSILVPAVWFGLQTAWTAIQAGVAA